MEGSAAVIGTMMLPILGLGRSGRGARAGPPARARLPAHQLHPGRRRGPRPRPDLPAAGRPRPVRGHPADLARGRRRGARPPRRSRNSSRYEVQRARRHYAAAAPGIPMLERSSQACIRAAYCVYGGDPRRDRAAGLRRVRRGRACGAASGCRAAGARHAVRPPGTPAAGRPGRTPSPPLAAVRDMHRTAVVLFTRDLRVHDNPALHAACADGERVVPLFVLDPAVPGPPATGTGSSPSRWPTCASRCAGRGGDLVVRAGRPGRRDDESWRREVDADGHRAGRRREPRTRARRERRLDRGVRGARSRCGCSPASRWCRRATLRPGGGGDHYKVFTPYWRAWQAAAAAREVGARRGRSRCRPASTRGRLPATGRASRRARGRRRDRRPASGSRRGSASVGDVRRACTTTWPGDGTSRLSPYLHFGCVSPLDLATAASDKWTVRSRSCGSCAGATSTTRCSPRSRICARRRTGRAADDDVARRPGRARGVAGRAAPECPIVDAGMRQLRRRGLDAQPGPARHRRPT